MKLRHQFGRLSAALALALAALGRAQSPAAAFEVASIQPSALDRTGGEGSRRSRIEYTPTSLSMRNVDAGECVQWAYGVRSYQVSGPASLSAGRYDILARTGSAVPVGVLRAMLQELLARRFQLSLHRETKPIPVYELVVAKGGPKLPAPKAAAPPSTPSARESLPRVQDGSFVFADATMADFAAKLSLLRGIELPVVDRTGIAGVFDITLQGAAAAILQPDGPSLFTLVQEQLGLRLAPAKAPVEVLVVDRLEKPSAN